MVQDSTGSLLASTVEYDSDYSACTVHVGNA